MSMNASVDLHWEPETGLLCFKNEISDGFFGYPDVSILIFPSASAIRHPQASGPRFTDTQIGTAQFRFVTGIAPKSPFLCANGSPSREGFCAGARAMEPWRFLFLNFDRITSQMVSSTSSVEPRYNEGTTGLQNLFAITRFRYMEVLFHIFYYYWGEENRSLNWGLRYIEVRYIEVLLYKV